MDPATVGAERPLAGDEPVGTASFLPVRSLTPRQVTTIYLAFGLVALFLSDLVLLWLLSDPVLRWVQAGKGLLEVLLTGGLIYLLTTASQESLRRTADEAERNQTEIQLLHRVLRHNLRNNLTLVLGNARQLREDLTDPSHRAYCQEVITAGEEIQRWTQQAGEIRRASADADPVELDLTTAIPSVVEQVSSAGGSEIDVSVPASATVSVNPQFELALEELVGNAVEYAEADRRPVSVRVEHRGTVTTIEVVDDGPGFPKHVLDAVNRRGEDQLVHLDGLGLWLAYLIVANSGGDLVLENTTAGAVARVSVPAA
jgi:signal transduction histidine kinase